MNRFQALHLRLLVNMFLPFAATAALADTTIIPAEKQPEPTSQLHESAAWLGVDGGTLDGVDSHDSDGFRRTTVRGGAMLFFDSPYRFVALGGSRDEFRQRRWTYEVNSIVLAGRSIERQTAGGFTGRLALTTNTKRVQWHGEGSWNIRLSERAGIELLANRDAVETAAALRTGVLSNFVGASLDYALSDRLTAIAMPTYQRFSDGYSRGGGRAWIIYGILPQYGISTELKARVEDASGKSRGRYFSPEYYERYEAGLRVRTSLGAWRLFATAALGQERINHEISNPTAIAMLNIQRSFTGNTTIGGQLSYYRAAGAGTSTDASGDYDWQMARLYLAIPF